MSQTQYIYFYLGLFLVAHVYSSFMTIMEPMEPNLEHSTLAATQIAQHMTHNSV